MDPEGLLLTTDMDDSLLLCAGAIGFAMFMMDDEDFWMLYQNKRQHRFWTRTWCQARDDEHQNNTMYKLQQELLQVSIISILSTPLKSYQYTVI